MIGRLQSFRLEGSMNITSFTTAWSAMQKRVIDYFSDPAVWTSLVFTTVKIVFIFIAARLIVKAANKTMSHMLSAKVKSPLKFDVRRTKTIGKLLENIVSYVVHFIMILMILNQLGIRLEPLLAGAGVVGLAVGFGAQSLVKDVITGFFIIFEDQFAVGDVVQIGTYKGTVEEIGLRVTKLKSWTGEVHFIPNGTIAQVTNYSLHNSIAIVDVTIAYESDIDQAIEILRETVMKVYETNVSMVKPPEVLGVQTLGTTEVTIRTTVECKANTQAIVSRELFAEVKKAFDARSIETVKLS
jgi:small-conductance mechanosensitive channel